MRDSSTVRYINALVIGLAFLILMHWLMGAWFHEKGYDWAFYLLYGVIVLVIIVIILRRATR